MKTRYAKHTTRFTPWVQALRELNNAQKRLDAFADTDGPPSAACLRATAERDRLWMRFMEMVGSTVGTRGCPRCARMREVFAAYEHEIEEVQT